MTLFGKHEHCQPADGVANWRAVCPCPNTASPLRLRLQKALKASAQGDAGLKGLQLLLCWQRGCLSGAFYGHSQSVTGGFYAAIGKLNRHDFAELLG